VSTATLTAALTHRLVLFAAAQLALTLAFALAGVLDPFTAAGAWWPVTAIVVNVASLVLMRWWLHRHDRRLRDVYRVEPHSVPRVLGVVLIVTVVALALGAGGSLGLGALLFGDPQLAVAALVHPLPAWAIIPVVVVFPLTTALVELPLYFGIVLPALRERGMGEWSAVILTGGALALQHVAMPLALDPAFIAWRALMFVAFAVFLAFALSRRLVLLPYLVGAHYLLDLAVALQFAAVAR